MGLQIVVVRPNAAHFGLQRRLRRMSWRRVLASAFQASTRGFVSRLVRSLAAAAMLTVAAPVLARAQDATRSVYTTIDLKTCRVLKKSSPEGASWRCPGLPGYPIYLAEGDDRFFISAGLEPEKRRAAKQTLKPFNTIFSSGTARATVEWRIPRTSRKAQPYASIVRYYTSSETSKGQVLVVSKITPAETCHAAYIDADTNTDAIERARLAADTTARTFNCTAAPSIEGAPGKSPL
jgi:hypothetical protein